MFDDDGIDPVEEPKPPKDAAFNPWRFASTDKSSAIVREAIQQVEDHETNHKMRKRKRKGADQQSFELIVEAVLCDLMHHRLYRRPNEVFVSRSNRVVGRKGRYRIPAYSKPFPHVLDVLASPELGWITQTLGEGMEGVAGRRTTIAPGRRLLDRMEHFGVTMMDLGFLMASDPIILKREKADYWDAGGTKDYADTTQTMLFRHQMEEINEWLRLADLDFGMTVGSSEPLPDTDERTLRRIFTMERFDCGGRLFGGFWQPISKEDRYGSILIENEDIVELDYGQMGPRQLYGMKGVLPDDDDLYDVPGFEDRRNGIKKVFSAMVFKNERLSQMPKGTRTIFGKDVHVDEVTEAIEARHADISDLFYQGIGHHLQFLESQIMVDILLKLKAMEIVALPIHDAILVPQSKAEIAEQVMKDTFFHHTSVPGVVTMEGGGSGLYSSSTLPATQVTPQSPFVSSEVTLPLSSRGGTEEVSSLVTIGHLG